MHAFRYFNVTENLQKDSKKKSSQIWRLRKTLPNIHGLMGKNLIKNKQTDIEVDKNESTQQNQH